MSAVGHFIKISVDYDNDINIRVYLKQDVTHKSA